MPYYLLQYLTSEVGSSCTNGEKQGWPLSPGTTRLHGGIFLIEKRALCKLILSSFRSISPEASEGNTDNSQNKIGVFANLVNEAGRVWQCRGRRLYSIGFGILGGSQNLHRFRSGRATLSSLLDSGSNYQLQSIATKLNIQLAIQCCQNTARINKDTLTLRLVRKPHSLSR